MLELKEGLVLEGPFWHEPVEIKSVEYFQDYIRIVGATVESKTYVDQLISKDEIQKLRIVDTSLCFTEDGLEAFLATEALRFRLASIFDPLLGMNISKVDPLPHQIEAVYGHILKLPKIRFLIADDPGAGKTIMAGLVIKELKLRGLANRILIVVPGHLKDQWMRELKEKFQETFYLIDRNTFRSIYGENPWEIEKQVITSMDFAKQEDILPSLNSTHWDLVIVDEAHKMSAYVYGNKTSRTERYRLGEILSKNTRHFLFLTATPHRGNPENFRLLLDLLEPGFFGTYELIEESIERGDNPLFIRRLKEDLRDFDGKPIFTNRYAKTIKFRLSQEEKELYNELSKYVLHQYNKAMKGRDQKRNVAFALLILQRRMASSTYALWKSLERRKRRLESLLEESKMQRRSFLVDFEEVEDYEEEERWKEEEEWETLTLAENPEELRREIWVIDGLIERAKRIVKEEREVKLQELRKAIEEGLKKIREMQGNEKILIFTESKDTLDYLVEKLKSWGYSVSYIHGGMSLEERIGAEKEFKEKTQVMVATEAAGEGINLQFCHIMINYDIPWNPNRLEQRLGRIHRYGQQKDVYMFNLVAEDTREGEVLGRILTKIEEIRNALGSDKVFDVIGDVFFGKNLYQLVLEAVANTRSLDEIIRELDIKVDEDYIRKIREHLGESLATKHIDYTRIKEVAQKTKEQRLVPEYVEEFFKKAFEKAGGRYRVRKDGFISIERIPPELRDIADDESFKSKYGKIFTHSYNKITFDKEKAFKNPDAEFVSFGHPLLEALVEWTIRRYSKSLQKGAVFEDPSGMYDGLIWFFEGEVKDGNGEIAGKTLIAIYEDQKGFREINPAILWDFVPKKLDQEGNTCFKKDKAQSYAIKMLEQYKRELLEERQRQANIKEKYGVRSLKHSILELDQELIELYQRQERGEKVDIAILNKQEQKRKYEKNLENLIESIKREVHLSMSMPKFLGAVLVKPAKGLDLEGDEEIERIGMEIAMNYERSQGREPKDVSKENLGFDIRSEGKGEIRYIEVKARRDEGFVALTPNEYFKAKRFKEQYWLYVVVNALSSPKLYIINNPAERLEFVEKTEVVRYILLPQEWKNKGEKQYEKELS